MARMYTVQPLGILLQFVRTVYSNGQVEWTVDVLWRSSSCCQLLHSLALYYVDNDTHTNRHTNRDNFWQFIVFIAHYPDKLVNSVHKFWTSSSSMARVYHAMAPSADLQISYWVISSHYWWLTPNMPSSGRAVFQCVSVPSLLVRNTQMVAFISTDTYDSSGANRQRYFFSSSFHILSAFIHGWNKLTSDYQLETVINTFYMCS